MNVAAYLVDETSVCFVARATPTAGKKASGNVQQLKNQVGYCSVVVFGDRGGDLKKEG